VIAFTNYHDGVQKNALPPHAQFCPVCRYDLRGTIEGNQSRCPECGFTFTIALLYAMNVSDPQGEPRSLAPRTLRVRGPHLLALMLVVVVFTILVMSILMSIA
jgi:hypothetical protein